MALSATVELNKFLVKKRKGIKDLSDGIYKLLEDTGNRGFILPQGELAYNLHEIIIMTKRAVSEANLAVLNEQIELELAIVTKEYHLQIEQAKINWDIEKGELLNALATEIAQLELSYDLLEEEINEAAFEIERRKSILLHAKTDLAVDIEELSKELALIDASTVGYEVLMIRAKITTATEKLKIIPYLQELVVKEEELLTVLSSNIGIENDLIDAKQQLILVKKSLLPLLSDKATKRSIFASATYDQAVVDLARADLLMSKAANEEDKTDAIIKIGTEEHNILAALNKDLLILRNNVEMARLINQISHIDAATDADVSVSSSRRDERTSLTSKDVNYASILRGADTTAFTTGQGERSNVTGISVTADEQEISGKASANAIATEGIAVISSKAEVTSKLIHVVGSA